MTSRLRIAIAIATTGRRDLLTEALRDVRRQTRAPDHIAICPATPADVDAAALVTLALPIACCHGAARGASAQRNALLREMPTADVVLFLDDDFLMASDYLAEVERLFAAEPDVILATGTLIADDVNGAGLTIEQARALISDAAPPKTRTTREVFNGYGCNMAVRWSALADKGVWFDENLPLYSWAEDVDFSRQAARYGRLVKCGALRGVHMATKQGRTRGVRFGYSQIANQIYLCRKGTITARLALLYGARNVLANLRGAIRPEPWIDRRGRLLGNLYGLADIVRGTSSPQRILDL